MVESLVNEGREGRAEQNLKIYRHGKGRLGEGGRKSGAYNRRSVRITRNGTKRVEEPGNDRGQYSNVAETHIKM